MTNRRLGRLASIVAGLAIAVAVAAIAGAASVSAASPFTSSGDEDAPRAIFFAADGMRPDLVDKYAAAGRDAHHDATSCASGVKGDNGLHAGLPAQHRRRLVHARDRHVAGRARLDEQHVPPHRRGQLQQPHERSPTTGILQADTIAAGRRARRQERSSRSSGSARATWCRPLQGPVVDFRTLLLEPRRPAQLRPARPARAGANAFGVSYQRVDLDAAAGWTNVPDVVQPGASRSSSS